MAKFLSFVLLGVFLEFALVVGILYFGYQHDTAHSKAEAIADVHHATSPPHRSDRYREWYLQSLWDIHHQTPDSRVLTALYRRSDDYIRRYITPRTGEDFEVAKTRILSPLGPDPSDLAIHTMTVLETYAASRCAEWYDQRCYLLDFTHWTVASQILAPIGQTTPYVNIVAGDYSRPWADWTIPRLTDEQ